MAFTIVQAGSSLQFVNTSGTLTTLTLPTGIVLNTSVTPRFTIFGKYVVIVNSPSRPIIVDETGAVRVLSLLPPPSKVGLTTAAGGSLTGTYTGVRTTFVVLDEVGNVISESDYSPAATDSASPSGQYLQVTGLPISTDTITARRLYRPTTAGDGSTLFKWLDVDGNVVTSVNDDTPDAGISLFASPTLGTAPDLTLITEWRSRLFGVSRTEVDNVVYTEAGVMYAWPTANTISIPRAGADVRGVTAFAPRREGLGVGKQNRLLQLTGTSNSDFRTVVLSENVGIESQESVVIINDAAYFLWKDGVYTWSSGGIKCISDGKVRSWFTTDSYFNRAMFDSAFAHYDQNRGKYRLFLAAAGGSTINRWVEYDLNAGTWWGPHKTDAFTPASAILVPDANDVLIPMIGSSSGYLFKDQATRTDSTSTAIAFSVDSKFHDAGTPDIEKYWGELSVIGKVQGAGTVTITPKVGYLDASTGTTFTYTMTNGRQRLGRLGRGQMVQLNFAHSTAGQNIELYGYEIAPVHEIGRR